MNYKQKWRTYCTDCKSFEVHNVDADENIMECNNCKKESKLSEYKVLLSEISKDEIDAQRIRYLKCNKTLLNYFSFLPTVTYQNYKQKTESESLNIIESDAGYKKEKEYARLIKFEAQQLIVDTIKHRDAFYNVGRNDLCPCGSKKKFKKCCMKDYPREKHEIEKICINKIKKKWDLWSRND